MTDIPKVQIDLEAEARDEVPDIEALAREVGLDAKVEASFLRRAAPNQQLEWVVYISSASGFAFGTFLGGFLKAAGDDAWKRLKAFVEGLYARRRKATGREGGGIWTVEDVHEEVFFRDGLPDLAYRELFRASIRKTESSQLRCDDDDESCEDSWKV